ncbi:MAG: TonB-dependent receptor plug domain-containing protein, partial [Planctomycetaceae bacterium]|nr:TonB-dependent receptor plug domain-containing protein [Planctomycetaceae bacterium]
MGKGILDAIAAEDIGQLPDPSIAESLMTLPGVSGNQDNGRSNTISVRGLGGGYTRSTLNGREIVSSFNLRSVNFSLYPGEVIRRGILYKTATPDLIEGGIAGTVDLHTIRPLGLKNNIRNVNVYGLYNDSASNSAFSNGAGQNISGMFTQKFSDTFAVAIGAVNLREQQRSERLNIGDIGYAGWHLDYDDDPETREFSAGGGGMQNHSREVRRDSVFATAQWRPTDRLEFIADVLTSNYEYDTRMATIYFWGLNSNNDEYAAYRDQAIIGEGGQVMRGYAPAVNFNVAPTHVTNRDKTNVFGLSTTYSGDEWTTSLDLSYSGARRKYAWMGTNAQFGDVPLTWDFTDIDNPSLLMDDGIDLTDMSQYGPIEKVSNPDNRSKTDLYAVKLDAEREIDNIFSRLRIGVRLSKQTKEQREDQEEYFDDAVTGLSLADVTEPFTENGAFTSFDGAMPSDWLFFSPLTVLAASGHANDERTWDAADQFASFHLQEKTVAFYVAFDFESELFGKPFYGTTGAR